MNKKGISPLIATILLIAITIVIGALITAWSTTYVSSQTQMVGGGGAACVYVGLRSSNCNLNQSNATHLYLIIENTGTRSISEIKATVQLATGEKKLTNVSDTDGRILTLDGQEAKPAYIVNPFTTININNTNQWNSITLWVYNPSCSEVKWSLSPNDCQ
ncbi:MAG: archaellin/type IV pilin N-terminal domain-containing protein [Nitrososphaeria archaeon]